MMHVEKWRSEAKTYYRFRDGKQLSDADAKQLKAEGRPDNAFNTVQKFIRFVTGVERHTPEALIFEPVDETSDAMQELGEVMTRYYDWVVAKAGGDFERSRAFDDLIVAGMGWTDCYVDRSIDPKGLIQLPRIPGEEMLWPMSKAQNISDTRWRARERLIDRDEAIAMWPDEEMLIKAAHLGIPTIPMRPEANGVVRYTIPYLETKPIEQGGAADYDSDKVHVLEWQWYENLAGYYFYDPLERGDVWYDDKKFELYRKNLKAATGDDPNYRIKDYVRQSQRVYKKIFLLNDRWQLGQELELPGKRFTFNCMTGYFDEEDKVHYGYMRVLVDPQRFGNKFFNQVIEIMGTQAKGGLLIEENAILAKQMDLFKKDYAKPGTVSIVADGAIQQKKIMPKPLPELPAASIAIVDFCIKAMENVTGISPETAFGQGSTNVPGITLEKKQKSGLLLLNVEFSSLSRFRLEEGYIIFDALKTLADDRLIRVGKPYEGEVLKLMREPFASTYDLMLDETERDPNIRHMYQEGVMALAPILIKQGAFMPELLDYFMLPVKFRQKVKQAMIQMAQANQKNAEQGIQTHGRGSPVSPQERQAKVRKIEADTIVQMVKAQRIRGQGEKDQHKMKMDQMKAILDGISMMAELKMAQQKQAAADTGKTLDVFLENKRIGVDEKIATSQLMLAQQNQRRKASKE